MPASAAMEAKSGFAKSHFTSSSLSSPSIEPALCETMVFSA